MHSIKIHFVTAAAVLALATAAAKAEDFFTLSAVGTSNTVVNAQGANVIDLANNLVNEKDQFSSLAGQGITGTLTYGGVPDAIVFTENAGQTSATLTIPSTGFTKTFTGTSSSDLQNQIENFIKTDGANAYSQFLLKVDDLSPVASIDGNPQASTAIIADNAFERFGWQPTENQEVINSAHSGYTLSVYSQAGMTRADGFNGNYADVSVAGNWQLADNIAFSAGTILAYRTVSSSAVYTVGEVLGLPITILGTPHNQNNGLSWQVTPWGFAGLSASYDQAEGTLLVGGGGTSSLALRMDDFIFTLADQANYTGNTTVEVDNYSFDVPIDQWIVKNGGQVAWEPNNGSFIFDAGIAYSDFLHHAAIPNYWTASGGVGIKLGEHTILRADYLGDFADHYTSSGGEVSLLVAF